MVNSFPSFKGLMKSEVRSCFYNGDLSKPPKTRSPIKAGLHDPIILIKKENIPDFNPNTFLPNAAQTARSIDSVAPPLGG